MFSERKRKGTSLYDVVTYTLPKLHTGKNWYVDFKCYDPQEGSMKRKKFMLDSIAKISERKKRATEIITVTTQRLRNGWNPWAEATTDRQCANFVYVTEIYNKYLEKLTSAKTLKQKTLYDYQSRLNMLLEYNNSRHLPIMYMYQFDQAYISDFLDYILLDRDASARTRNNYRTWLSTFCTWLKEKKYIEDNPTDKIRSLAEETKFRSALTKEDLAQLHEYLKEYLEKLTSAKTLKQKTLYDYQSRLNMLLEYNNSRHLPIMYMYQFDQAYISDFLDYILLDRDASARTRNNYRTWLSTFCTWLKEKKYIEDNPTDKIRSLAEETKFRSALTKEDLAQLHEYLKETNKHFLLACQMEYYTFIRPDELSNIRLGDIKIKEQKVFVSSTISKNRRDGMVGLNDSLVKLMIELDIFRNSSDYYLFGKDFKPSIQKADSRIFREYFNKVRAFLRYPKNYQFYSLKDSGIRDLANAEGIVIARDQARHADISTTNKYLKGDNMTVHEETKHFEGNL